MTHHTQLGEGRRVILPVGMCDRLGLAVGDTLALVEDGDALRIIPCARLLRDVQDAFAPYHAPGESLVDGLIADRRAEDAHENTRNS